MKSTNCRSKNPVSCPYHGRGLSAENLQTAMNIAIKKQDFQGYALNRDALDEMNRDNTFPETLSRENLNPVPQKSHEPLVLLTRVSAQKMKTFKKTRMTITATPKSRIAFAF